MTIVDHVEALDAAVARCVRGLRGDRGLTLEALAERAGVSRSMISKIERAEVSPTAALLERLCGALGTTLSALFALAREAPGGPLARRAAQPVWCDPATGYRRREVSPPGAGSGVEIVEVDFPAGARVTFDHPGRRRPVLDQHVWVLDGGPLEIAVGGARHRLEAGDCLSLRVEGTVAYHNPGTRSVRYAVILSPAP